jgi:ABC-type transport system involved in multi-copper enzyme maturation permease subunit
MTRSECIPTLYIKELKATVRGRFAWIGAAIVLQAVGGLATIGTQDDTWLDGYGIIAFDLLPLGFIPVAAGMIVSLRFNRFVECVFTAPGKRRDWLAAKFLVLMTLAVACYFALVPIMPVYIWHVGLPPLLHKFLIWAPGLLIGSIAVGTLIGVLFIGCSLAAPVGAGIGILLALAGLMPLRELMPEQQFLRSGRNLVAVTHSLRQRSHPV